MKITYSEKEDDSSPESRYDLAIKYLGHQNIEGFDGPMGWMKEDVIYALRIAAGLETEVKQKFY